MALLTPEQLTLQLSVPVTWVYEQSRQGNIPTHRIDGTLSEIRSGGGFRKSEKENLLTRLGLYGYTYNPMKPKTTKGDKTIRIKVTTTLRRDLYEALQIECIKRRCNANDILEELIAEHLKSSKKKGGE